MSDTDSAALRVVTRSLVGLGLLEAGANPVLTPLTGGVSSDIWRVDWGAKRFCVKRARARLKVAARWEAPVERSLYEARWLRAVGEIIPGGAPALLGHDGQAGVLAMAYLAPEKHRLWKEDLLAGVIDEDFAALVGSRLGTIHARTAGRPEMAEAFASDHIFYPIRLEPYLIATGRRHPDLAVVLTKLAEETAATRKALVHGDVSPKNILVGPAGPVLLDGECAWYGDPAFDLAFCLNHLLLKSVHRPARAGALLSAFDRLVDGYGQWLAWEPPAVLYRRVARLLPGLLLARVDGKSPVEYLSQGADLDLVRRVARSLLLAPVETPGDVAEALREGLRKR